MVELGAFRLPDYVFLLVIYPALVTLAVVGWAVTKARPKGKSLHLVFSFLGITLTINNKSDNDDKDANATTLTS